MLDGLTDNIVATGLSCLYRVQHGKDFLDSSGLVQWCLRQPTCPLPRQYCTTAHISVLTRRYDVNKKQIL